MTLFTLTELQCRLVLTWPKSGGSNIPPPLLFRRPWDITTYLCTKESCNIHTVVLVPPKHIGHAYFTYASYFSTVSKNFSIPFMGMNPWNFVNLWTCEIVKLWNCEIVNCKQCLNISLFPGLTGLKVENVNKVEAGGQLVPLFPS